MGFSLNGGANMLTQEALKTTKMVNAETLREEYPSFAVDAELVKDLQYTKSGFVDNRWLQKGDIVKFTHEGVEYVAEVGEKIANEPFDYWNLIYYGKKIPVLTSFDWTENITMHDVEIYRDNKSLAASSVQTWSDQTNVLGAEDSKQADVWRKKAAYSWIGTNVNPNEDGLYLFSDYEPFDAWNEGEPSSGQWQKNGEVTLYDINSHAIEAKDINGNFASTRFDPYHEKVIASSANAAYSEMAYCGAEYISGTDESESGIEIGDGFASSVRAHTGKFSLQVAYGDTGFSYKLNKANADLSKKYFASVWVYLPGQSETVDNIVGAQLYYSTNKGKEVEVHPTIQKNKSKSWYLIEMEIDPSGADDIVIGCRNNTARNVYFDDFRIHPLDAAMTSYVYDAFSDELTYILDANNFYTQFEYDVMGRLVRTKRELLNFDFGDGKESFRADKIIGETIYNYGNSHE